MFQWGKKEINPYPSYLEESKEMKIVDTARLSLFTTSNKMRKEVAGYFLCPFGPIQGSRFLFDSSCRPR